LVGKPRGPGDPSWQKRDRRPLVVEPTLAQCHVDDSHSRPTEARFTPVRPLASVCLTDLIATGNAPDFAE